MKKGLNELIGILLSLCGLEFEMDRIKAVDNTEKPAICVIKNEIKSPPRVTDRYGRSLLAALFYFY